MPADPNPTIRRRRLGAELRRLREAAGLSLEDVAGHMECHKATISRLELGRSGARPRDLRAILALYGVTDPETVGAYLEMSNNGRHPGWWQAFKDTLPPAYSDFIALEAESDYIRAFQPALVPGLLQTPEYARAVTRANPSIIGEELLDRFVKVRTERQALLDGDNPVRFWGIIGEATLRTPIGGPEVMAAQLEHLIELSRRPNIDLQVLPFSAGEHAGLSGPFLLMNFPLPRESQVVFLENLTSSLYLERPEEIAGYTLAFDALRSSALNLKESLATIRAALRDL
jgi:transcriptional regulator with XRE-family HTH domain